MRFSRMILGLLMLGAPSFGAVLTYTATLTGPGENPSNTSPGTGFAEVTIDTLAQSMNVLVSFSGLEAGTTASHIHCCVAPPAATGVATTVPTFPNFPLGVTAGTYNMTFDLTAASTYNPAFVTANGGTTASAESTLLAGIAAGDAYLNIHTTMFPGGEIRGFLTQTPEPATAFIAGLLLVGLGLRRRYHGR